jgi:hypothetical protein
MKRQAGGFPADRNDLPFAQSLPRASAIYSEFIFLAAGPE